MKQQEDEWYLQYFIINGDYVGYDSGNRDCQNQQNPHIF